MGLGHGPSDLDQYNKEVRGSFAVRVFGASGQPEMMLYSNRDVSDMILTRVSWERQVSLR